MTDMADKAKTDEKDVLASMRDFRERAQAYWSDIYTQAKTDVEFVAKKETQWDAAARQARKKKHRPCLAINKLALFVQQQINAVREEGLGLKTIAVDDSDTDGAELRNNLLQHVLQASRSEIATDLAYEQALSGGFGFWRVTTGYESEVSFNQDIQIKRIENQFSTYVSPESRDPTGMDATEAITGEWLSKREFKAQYPKIEAVSADDESEASGWQDSDSVFIAEYYRIEWQTDTLYQLATGEAVLKSQLKDYSGDLGLQIVNERQTQTKKVMWYKCTRDTVLEQTEIKADFIPIILVVGSEKWVENTRYYQSLIANAKDSQVLYNYARTLQAEQLRKAMNRPLLADAKSIQGYESYWEQANNPDLAYLPYNSTDGNNNPLAPPRYADVYQGSPDLMREAMTTSDEMKAVTGIFDASLGAQSNETSGKAIMARQRQGNQANYHFLDNFKRSYEHMGRVILSMIPHYYDTARVVRITQENGEEKAVLINTPANSPLAQKYVNELKDLQPSLNGLYNDLSVGKYDIRLSTGASYKTQREEARELLMELGRNNPQLMQTAGDYIVKGFDFSYADEIAERIKRTIPPEILGEDGEQPDIPPEMQQQLQQLQQALQQLQGELQQAQQEAEGKQADRENALLIAQMKAQADIEIARIRESGRNDQEEIKGMIQLLLQRMQPPPDWAKQGEDLQNPASEQGFLMPENDYSHPPNGMGERGAYVMPSNLNATAAKNGVNPDDR